MSLPNCGASPLPETPPRNSMLGNSRQLEIPEVNDAGRRHQFLKLRVS